MSERYQPPSDFLNAIMDGEVPITGGEFANANLQRLIEMTRDRHPANRDWATMLLGQYAPVSPQVTEALLQAAEDQKDAVRAEAIFALAERDKAAALPFLQRELAGRFVAMPIFEAAALVADPSLVEDLRAFAAPTGDDSLDDWALAALKACEAGRAA